MGFSTHVPEIFYGMGTYDGQPEVNFAERIQMHFQAEQVTCLLFRTPDSVGLVEGTE